jgi:hypothetical protein
MANIRREDPFYGGNPRGFPSEPGAIPKRSEELE